MSSRPSPTQGHLDHEGSPTALSNTQTLPMTTSKEGIVCVCVLNFSDTCFSCDQPTHTYGYDDSKL